MQLLEPHDPLLVVIGPSGTGKSAAVRQLAAEGILEVTATWTTRPRRPDEEDGSVEHRFVTEDEFEAAEADGHFLGVVKMFGLEYRYGLPAIPKPSRGAVPAILLRAPLIAMLLDKFPETRIYQVEDSLERATARLSERGHEPGDRMSGFDAETQLGRGLAKRIFTNDREMNDLVTAMRTAIQLDFA